MTEIEARAQAILASLTNVPFSNCIPISRNFENLTTKAGLYAVSLNFMQWLALSSELERIIPNTSEPPFNVLIPMRD